MTRHLHSESGSERSESRTPAGSGLSRAWSVPTMSPTHTSRPSTSRNSTLATSHGSDTVSRGRDGSSTTTIRAEYVRRRVKPTRRMIPCFPLIPESSALNTPFSAVKTSDFFLQRFRPRSSFPRSSYALVSSLSPNAVGGARKRGSRTGRYRPLKENFGSPRSLTLVSKFPPRS